MSKFFIFLSLSVFALVFSLSDSQSAEPTSEQSEISNRLDKIEGKLDQVLANQVKILEEQKATKYRARRS